VRVLRATLFNETFQAEGCPPQTEYGTMPNWVTSHAYAKHCMTCLPQLQFRITIHMSQEHPPMHKRRGVAAHGQ
jgi:hypothetical protein